MTHRDGFSALSARSLCRGDAGHRETKATQSESAEKPPCRSSMGCVGGRQQALTMRRIAGGLLPTRQVPEAIPMGHYYHPLVLTPNCASAGRRSSLPSAPSTPGWARHQASKSKNCKIDPHKVVKPRQRENPPARNPEPTASRFPTAWTPNGQYLISRFSRIRPRTPTD